MTIRTDRTQVLFNYVSEGSRALAESLVFELMKDGKRAACVRADMASEDAPYTIVRATVEAFQTGHIDILVNNAGVALNAPLNEVTQHEVNTQMRINVSAVIFMTQALLPYLNRTSTGNRIVNLSSISARGGFATQTVYGASKAAVEGLTRVWAKELGQKYNVTVNAVNPGPVDTDMYRAAGEVHLARMEEQNKQVPAAARCGTAEDVADIVTFLCTEKARWITGDVICANGGMLFV